MRTDGHVVRTIVAPDGRRRVLIIARHDGHYGYAEERVYEHEGVTIGWVPTRLPASICDSLETAEREARAALDWLRAISN